MGSDDERLAMPSRGQGRRVLAVVAGVGESMRRAAKVDANQEQIVSALRAAGATVQSLAAVGKGCPDVLAAFRGAMYLFEIKQGKGKVNELQERWHIAWNAPVYVVYGPEDALMAIGAIHAIQE